MAGTVSAAERAARGALSGLVLKRDGTVYDWQAALESVVAALGGSEVSGLDELVALAQAAVLELEKIQASTADSATSLNLIDDTIGTIDSAHGNKVTVVGAKAESGVPTEVADADAAALWVDTFGRLVQLATDVAQNAMSVSDIAPAVMQTARWLDWVALTAPDAETPEANVQDYSNHTVQYTVASINTNVTLKIWGSLDGGSTWFLMTPAFVVAANGTDAIVFSGVPVERIKCEFDAESGGTDATVTFKLMSKN